MAQEQGTVISVGIDVDVAKNGGGTYKGWELIYRTPNGEVRTLRKPIQGLRFNAPLKAILQSLVAGDNFTLVQEKNQQGYLDVKSISKGFEVGVSAPTAQSAGNTGQPRAASSAGNAYASRDFESKDERTVKQRLIVRQSSLSQAVSVLSVGAKSSPKPQEILELAQVFTDWVYGGSPREVAEQAVQDIESDIPY